MCTAIWWMDTNLFQKAVFFDHVFPISLFTWWFAFNFPNVSFYAEFDAVLWNIYFLFTRQMKKYLAVRRTDNNLNGMHKKLKHKVQLFGHKVIVKSHRSEHKQNRQKVYERPNTAQIYIDSPKDLECRIEFSFEWII